MRVIPFSYTMKPAIHRWLTAGRPVFFSDCILVIFAFMMALLQNALAIHKAKCDEDRFVLFLLWHFGQLLVLWHFYKMH